MTTATVVLCPPLPGTPSPFDGPDLADALLEHRARGSRQVMSPYLPEPEADDDARTTRAHWVAHLSIALAGGRAEAPILLVLGGASGGMAAAIGFSQRAARRRVSGYALIDAVVPPADDRTEDWPDAPVHYLASPAADPLEVNQARLRGWSLLEVGDLEPATLADALTVIAAL